MIAAACWPNWRNPERPLRSSIRGGMAVTEEESAVLAAVDEAELTALLGALVRCPSPNPPGCEEETVAHLAQAVGCAQR